jgi:hypothetical protein
MHNVKHFEFSKAAGFDNRSRRFHAQHHRRSAPFAPVQSVPIQFKRHLQLGRAAAEPARPIEHEVSAYLTAYQRSRALSQSLEWDGRIACASPMTQFGRKDAIDFGFHRKSAPHRRNEFLVWSVPDMS